MLYEYWWKARQTCSQEATRKKKQKEEVKEKDQARKEKEDLRMTGRNEAGNEP